MISNLYAKLAALGMIVVLIVGAAMYFHHAGAVSQRAKDAVKLTNAATALDNAVLQLGADADAFRRIEGMAALEQAKALTQQNNGARAVKQAEADAKEQAKSAAAWQRKFQAAAKSKGCATLMEQQICAAVFKD